MISYNYNYPFKLQDEQLVTNWILAAIESEGFVLGELSYTFLNDEELHKMNVEYLDHDTFTDIISFDYTVGKVVQGDIFISVDRVQENAKNFDTDFENEMARVMVHGVLHYCGYKDKTPDDKIKMRAKEDLYLNLLK